MRDEPDHYGALSVDPDADPEAIQEAWRFTLQAYHPDKFRDPDQRARAEEITKAANAAWQVLRDPTTRRRYDHLRPLPERAARPAMRSIPCPSCSTPGQVADQAGATVDLVCPACRIGFQAMVGAVCVMRPTLTRAGWFRLHYTVAFRDGGGDDRVIRFRSFPKELALSQGERFSVVFDPRSGRPVYAVNHAPEIDLAWKVS
jgi:curved DNA-binding protein CbpA